MELNAEIVGNLTKSNFFINHYSESRQHIDSMKAGRFLIGLNHLIVKYRRLSILQIIRYWTEVLLKLETLAMDLKKSEIPYLIEVFAIFYNSDKLFLTSKEFK